MHHAVSACTLALTGIEPRLEAPRDRSGLSDLYAARAAVSGGVRKPLFGTARDLDQRIPGNWAAQMASKQVSRNRLSYHKGSAKVAPWKCPSRSAGLDPIVADVIEAHVGTMAALESMAEVY